jgi:MFS transporter, putative metabolite:H+ symporter
MTRWVGMGTSWRSYDAASVRAGCGPARGGRSAWSKWHLLTGPFLLQRGYSLSNTLMVVGLATFGPSISTFITGLYIDRIERTTALALCGALSLAAVAVYGIAQGLYVPVMVTYGSEILPTKARASATSGAWAMNRTGSVLVPLSVIPAFH